MVKQTRTKNEYMTMRDPGEILRKKIDRARVLEGKGVDVPPSRTEMLHILLDRALAEKNNSSAV